MSKDVDFLGRVFANAVALLLGVLTYGTPKLQYQQHWQLLLARSDK
jgi:hypothetical protein